MVKSGRFEATTDFARLRQPDVIIIRVPTPLTHKMREHDLRTKSKPFSARILGGYDAVLIGTDHSAYDYQFVVDHARLIVDTRDATGKVKGDRGKIAHAASSAGC